MRIHTKAGGDSNGAQKMCTHTHMCVCMRYYTKFNHSCISAHYAIVATTAATITAHSFWCVLTSGKTISCDNLYPDRRSISVLTSHKNSQSDCISVLHLTSLSLILKGHILGVSTFSYSQQTQAHLTHLRQQLRSKKNDCLAAAGCPLNILEPLKVFFNFPSNKGPSCYSRSQLPQ